MSLVLQAKNQHRSAVVAMVGGNRATVKTANYKTKHFQTSDMTIAEKLAQIKKLVFDTATPPQPAAAGQGNAKQYKLQDGTPVLISTLTPGGDVLINGSPAKAGSYTLQDGTQFTVDEKSKITAVTPAGKTPAQQPAKASPAADDGSGDEEDGQDMTEAFKALKKQVAAQQQAFDAYKECTDKKLGDHAAQMDKHHEALRQMFEVVQKIAKSPTGAAPEPPKAKFSFSRVNDRKEMMNRYLHAMDELRGSK